MFRIIKLEKGEFLHKGEGLEIAITHTQKKLEIYDVVILNGKYYTVVSKAEDKIGIEEFTPLNKEKLNWESFIICPYCGYEEKDSWEQDDIGTTECGNCGAELEFEREITVQYHIELKRKPDIVNLDEEGGRIMDFIPNVNILLREYEDLKEMERRVEKEESDFVDLKKELLDSVNFLVTTGNSYGGQIDPKIPHLRIVLDGEKLWEIMKKYGILEGHEDSQRALELIETREVRIKDITCERVFTKEDFEHMKRHNSKWVGKDFKEGGE